MGRPVTRRAHAKLNLALWVGPRLGTGHARAGFHPICSWMSCIDLFDEVTVEPLATGGSGGLRVEWAADAPRPTPIDWPHERDLAWRAVRALEARAGRALPCRVTVIKRIPAGSGLGGGSSDAGAALAAANEAFGLGLGAAELREVGATLGSDVPFFLDDTEPARPAIVSGVGERVERLARLPADVILVVPPYRCATAAVYGAFDELETQGRPARAAAGGARAHWGEVEDETLVRRRAARAIERCRVEGRFLFNALTGAASRVEPRLRELLAEVSAATNYHTRLTGSGSCVFLPVEPGFAERCRENLARAVSGADPGSALAGCAVVRACLV